MYLPANIKTIREIKKCLGQKSHGLVELYGNNFRFFRNLIFFKYSPKLHKILKNLKLLL